MPMISTRQLLTLVVFLAWPAHPAAADSGAPAPPVLVGMSEKVCQLTGEIDWETGQPTAARTMTNAGLEATDVGSPVEHEGKLFLLFGDTWPSPNEASFAAAEIPPDDAVGVIQRRKIPTGKDGKCLEMEIRHSSGEKKKFTPPTIVGPTHVKQGMFDVPTGGISAAGKFFAFFWTNHCMSPNPLKPLPASPLLRPTPVAKNDCPETDDRNSLGTAVMAQSEDEGRTFDHVVALPTGFNTPVAVNPALESEVPREQRLGVFIFAGPRYRASVPYLAYVPPESLSDTNAWRFFAGRNAEGKPKWLTRSQWQGAPAAPADWRPPQGAEVFSPDSDKERCIGELSVSWNRPLHKWLMAYNCEDSGIIEARIADAPWGPWSNPVRLLSSDGQYLCHLFMRPEGCGTQRDYWPMFKREGKLVHGVAYAPFILNRYTRPATEDGGYRGTIVYWIVSTWNPYQVILMRSHLRLDDNSRTRPHDRIVAND